MDKPPGSRRAVVILGTIAGIFAVPATIGAIARALVWRGRVRMALLVLADAKTMPPDAILRSISSAFGSIRGENTCLNMSIRGSAGAADLPRRPTRSG